MAERGTESAGWQSQPRVLTTKSQTAVVSEECALSALNFIGEDHSVSSQCLTSLIAKEIAEV